ncbi:MAG: hypothetical protein ACREHF_14745 [Rhizomicrobium sp.]
MEAQGAGATKQHGGIVERLHIGPEVDSEENGLAYFTTALNFTGTSRPLISATTICGCLGSTTGTDYSDTSPRYAAGTHIILDDCYSPDLESVRLWNATLGVSYDCPTTLAQGFTASGCTMIGLRTGMYIRHKNNPNPNGILANNMIQFRDIGMDVGNIDTWRFPGNAFFLEGDIPRATPAYDMRFVASANVSITGAGFGTFCTTSSDCGYRVNIRIDAEIPSYGVARGDRFLIDTGLFGDQSQYFALTAIQTTPSARNIHIGASNAYHGQFSGAVVDDQSGTAVTLAGFPTTNNLNNPAAVVPNGANVTQGPTLGSAKVPWPATFNVLQTVPQSNQPTKPGSGWTLFTDTDGSLKALYQDGKTIVTVALAPS